MLMERTSKSVISAATALMPQGIDMVSLMDYWRMCSGQVLLVAKCLPDQNRLDHLARRIFYLNDLDHI